MDIASVLTGIAIGLLIGTIVYIFGIMPMLDVAKRNNEKLVELGYEILDEWIAEKNKNAELSVTVNELVGYIETSMDYEEE